MVNPSGPHPFTATVAPNSPDSTTTTSSNGPLLKSFFSQHAQHFPPKQLLHSLDEQIERLDTCCGARLDSRRSLQLLALLNCLIDVLCASVSLHLQLPLFVVYVFAASAAVSLLSLCAVVNGVQEEKKRMLKVPAVYAGIKAVVLGVLWATGVAALAEQQLLFPCPDADHSVAPFGPLLLLLLLPVCVCSLCLQCRLSRRVVRLIRLRDALYVIKV